MSSQTIEDLDIAPKEYIEIDIWEQYLAQIVQFISGFEGKVDVVSMLGQIKMKIDDCSRIYTGMWTLDTFHQAYEKDGKKLGATFKRGLDTLQSRWNDMMMPIREERKQRIARKCIHMFMTEYEDATKIMSRRMVEDMLGKTTAHDIWSHISKEAHASGWTNEKPYKTFLSKLMVEMTKY